MPVCSIPSVELAEAFNFLQFLSADYELLTGVITPVELLLNYLVSHEGTLITSSA